MYAIVAASGKQFRVAEGDRIVVDRVPAGVGETVQLDSVLLVGGDDRAMIGTPFVTGAFLEATVLSHRAGDKVIVFTFKARKRHRRKMGHRQLLSELKIGAIHRPGIEPAPEPAPATGKRPAARRRAGPTARKKAQE